MTLNRLVSIAPMLECTDRHDRFFLRLISPHVLLYTEMITTQALLHGNFQQFLTFHPFEHPIALQLGGHRPDALTHCALLGEDWGYDEINLNIGCPSARVKSGQFGACLMLTPERVAECVNAMQNRVNIPVTVKCRIGVDDYDSYEDLTHFIKTVSDAGCRVFIIHARKAWLNGLSPKQNRTIPPLKYDVVYHIKKDFPHLTIIINGGIQTLAQINDHLKWVDGVMIGRKVYSDPYFLAEIEQALFDTQSVTREEIMEQFIPYIQEELDNQVKLTQIVRHILGLFLGQKGGRIWRRYLSEHAHKKNSGIETLRAAMTALNEARSCYLEIMRTE